MLACLYGVPISYLGLLSKAYILVYLLFMFIGYLFLSKRSSVRLPLVASPSSYAIVTGASSGVGAQMCRQLARHDFNLILVARSQSKLAQLAKELQQMHPRITIHILVQDLAEPDAVANLTRRIDALQDVRIDILINNAGRGCTKPFLQMPANDNAYEQMIALHVRTPTLLIRHYLPTMLDRPARIVNVSSEISYMSSPRAAVYASTKAFLTHLTTSLDYEMEQLSTGTSHVSFLLATPGPTLDTEFDGHNESVVFRFPLVTLTAEQVAKQIDLRVNKPERSVSLLVPLLT